MEWLQCDISPRHLTKLTVVTKKAWMLHMLASWMPFKVLTVPESNLSLVPYLFD